MPLPSIPDDDSDFTPDLARKIIAKYMEMLAAGAPPVYAWRCNDERYKSIFGIVTDRKVTVDAWRAVGIKFEALGVIHTLAQIVAPHASDCSVHNAPALPIGPCDCGLEPIKLQDALKVSLSLLRDENG